MDNLWSLKVKELEAKGWTLTGIGAVIGLSLQSVSGIKHGRCLSPGGMAAVLLYNLHASCRKPIGNKRRKATPVSMESAA